MRSGWLLKAALRRMPLALAVGLTILTPSSAGVADAGAWCTSLSPDKANDRSIGESIGDLLRLHRQARLRLG